MERSGFARCSAGEHEKKVDKPHWSRYTLTFMALLGRANRRSSGSRILEELQGLRAEVAGLVLAVDRIATALELRNAHDWPQQVQGSPSSPVVEISYADEDYQRETMDIELRLTAAKGIPPSEDEILEEYERRRAVEQQDIQVQPEPRQ